jgi:hypothetical protein
MWVVLAVVLRGTDRRCRSSPVFEGDFEGAVEAYRQALDAFVNGDPEHVVKLFSRRDDVTLGNLLGGRCRGPTELEHAIREAAAMFKDGSGTTTSTRCRDTPLLSLATSSSSWGSRRGWPVARP